ncbi:MAG: Fpg/Nei family DNA glycosylase [Vicinamibacterales bacterium]
MWLPLGNMPELPDLTVYIDALRDTLVTRPLERFRLLSPFVLRSVAPSPDALEGRQVTGVSRLGKRIVLEFGAAERDRVATSPDADLFLVLHLMIAGRLRWRPRPGVSSGSRLPPKPPASRVILAHLTFEHGDLFFTEAGSTKRASLQVVSGRTALRELDPGGIEPLDASAEAFRVALSRERHTLKRALTDPHLISGIGNAYSDEILHAARLSPLTLTSALTADEWDRLHKATQATLRAWIGRLRADARSGFPEKVTAFHDTMAVHGRFRQPCPVCGAPVQRIVYAHHECNYCARCQTGGRVLADRSLSRLLRESFPRSLD